MNRANERGDHAADMCFAVVLSTSYNDEVIFPEKWGRGMFFRPLFVKNQLERAQKSP
jgi:hypothetical protein